MEGPARPIDAPPPTLPVDIAPDGGAEAVPGRDRHHRADAIPIPKDDTEWTTRWTSSPLLRGASPLTVGKPWPVRDR